MKLYLNEHLTSAWQGRDVFAVVDAIDGEIFRHKEGRKTLRFTLEDHNYFLKLHKGVGWKEIFKNLLQLRLPVVGAENEWRAIAACHACGVDTLTTAGYGKRGINPARQMSFLVTEELSGVVSLEDYCRPWREQPPTYALKKALITRLALVCRRFHERGLNHRDFYLCHFLLPESAGCDPAGVADSPLYLIDLHRAQIRHRVPRRWLIKDLASLYYSALDIGLTARDVVRFLRLYQGGSVKNELRNNAGFWQQVRRRAIATYKRDFGRAPALPI